jgi:hypothetical protein
VLDRFDRALVDLVREEGADGTESAGIGSASIVEIGELADHLGDVLRSHLAYEEDELAGALELMPTPV